jgi:two-component system sensor histidine kinase RegB
LYFSGGANNPFISYLLVPLCISAATLPWAYTWLLGAIGFGAYSLLLFNFIPLEAVAPNQHQHGGAPNTHILGMWANFLVSTVLITYFVFKMAHSLRLREAELASSREHRLQDEQLLAVASLAAGTAHELGTPLSTMKVVLEDLTEQDFDTETRADLATLGQQLDHCRDILTNLVSTARDLSADNTVTTHAPQYLALLQEHSSLSPALCNMTLKLDGTVSQAILNLLSNGADTSTDDLRLDVLEQDHCIIFAISDRGPGLSTEQAAMMSKAFVSSKGKGRGLGLFLSNATAIRYGGELRWRRRDGGGSRVELCLPIAKVCP